MKNATLVSISLVSTTILTASAAVALAEPAAGTYARMPAIDNAIEIALATGYAHGVGDISDTTGSIEDIAGAGVGVELSVGYRVTPNLAVAAYGAATGHEEGSHGSDVGTFAAGLKADWHFTPRSEIDPWVSLGSGVRWMAIDETGLGEHRLFGLDLAKVQAGVDFRVSPAFSIGPVIGATATQFLAEDNDMTDAWDELDDSNVSFNFQAGLIGRFDAPLAR